MRIQFSTACALLILASACSGSGTDSEDGTGGSGLAAGGSSGGLASGGAASGGASSAGGAPSGGAAAGGASSGGTGGATGGAVSGGAPAAGGASGGAASGGAASGGGGPDLSLVEALSGLRIDDPCAGSPQLTVGATCDHVMLTGGAFHQAKTVTIGGTEGEVYDVTLRVRGVVEPTNVVGGMRTGSETVSYMGQNWRKVPWTVGGSVPPDDTDYAQWSILVSEPEQRYYMNDYQRVGHFVFSLDYEVTIPVAAGSEVTLDANDDNERLILNYEQYAPEGVSGSMNLGQFVELDVVGIALHKEP